MSTFIEYAKEGKDACTFTELRSVSQEDYEKYYRVFTARALSVNHFVPLLYNGIQLGEITCSEYRLIEGEKHGTFVIITRHKIIWDKDATLARKALTDFLKKSSNEPRNTDALSFITEFYVSELGTPLQVKNYRLSIKDESEQVETVSDTEWDTVGKEE